MSGPDGVKCASCKWYEAGSGPEGHCHAALPAMVIDGSGRVWPQVSSEDWCRYFYVKEDGGGWLESGVGR